MVPARHKEMTRMTRLTLTLGMLILTAAVAAAQISFAPAVSLLTGSRPDDIAIADFDGNGFRDIAVTVDTPDRVQIFFGNGTGAFPTSSTVLLPASSSPSAVVAADFDANGSMDLAVALKDFNQVILAVNSGAGAFTLGTTAATGQGPRYMVAADLDGDAFPELVTANRDSNDITVVDNLFGALGGSVNFAAGLRPQGVGAGDVNGDGAPDVVCSNHDDRTLSVFIGDGLGGLTTTATLSVGGQVRPEDLRVADINGDGLMDIAAATSGNGFNTVTYFLNSLAGFGAPMTVATGGVEPGDLEVVDLDGDGLRDFATANKTSNDASVMRNLGGGLFGAPTILAAGIAPERILSGDLDGDGDRDLVVANRDSNDLTVFLNTTQTGGGNMPTYPGSNEDLTTETAVGIGNSLTGGTGFDVKPANAGDLIRLRFASPNGTFDLLPPLVVAQIFVTGNPPAAPSTFPYLHIDIFATPSPFVLIDGGIPNPLNLGEVVLPGGNVHGWVVLPGFSGLSVVIQPLVLAPVAANGIFAAADAHEIQFN